MKSSRRPLALVFTALGLAATPTSSGAAIAHPIQFQPAPMPNWEELYPPEPRPACTTHDMSYRPQVWDPVIFGRYDPLDYQEWKWAHDETADALPSFSVVLSDVIPARASLLGGMYLIGGVHIRTGINGALLWTGPGWWSGFEDFPPACKFVGPSYQRQLGGAIGLGGHQAHGPYGGQWEAPARRHRAMLLSSYELHGGASTIP